MNLFFWTEDSVIRCFNMHLQTKNCNGNEVFGCYGLLEKSKTHNGYELDNVFEGIVGKKTLTPSMLSVCWTRGKICIS